MKNKARKEKTHCDACGKSFSSYEEYTRHFPDCKPPMSLKQIYELCYGEGCLD